MNDQQTAQYLCGAASAAANGETMVCAENETCVMEGAAVSAPIVAENGKEASPAKKNFDAIDICKLIAALFVVGIHAGPLDSFNSLANYLNQTIANLLLHHL